MKIIPALNHIYIKVEVPKAGALDTSSKPSAIEYAKILAVADNVSDLKVGDTVFFKSWAVDIISMGEEMYHFIDVTSGGIKAIVK